MEGGRNNSFYISDDPFGGLAKLDEDEQKVMVFHFLNLCFRLYEFLPQLVMTLKILARPVFGVEVVPILTVLKVSMNSGKLFV